MLNSTTGDYLVSKSIERIDIDLENIVNKYKKNILHLNTKPILLWNKIKFIDSTKYFDESWNDINTGLSYIANRRKFLPLLLLKMEEIIRPKFNILINPNQFWVDWNF